MLRELQGARDDPRAARALARGFGLLLALTVCLVVLGALVRAHGAGLACPDWPLCFGELVPEIDLHVGFEYVHRVLAGSVGLAFAALAALALSRRGTRRAAGPFLALAGALLAVQVLLGALTVWKLLAPWTVTAHLVTGNAFAAMLLLTALALRDHACGATPSGSAAPALRGLVCGAAALLALQLVLGGLVSSRYAGLACSEWPACRDGVWFPTWSGPVGLHLLHRVNGYALAALLAGAALAARGTQLARVTALAAALVFAQLAVGVANVRLGIPVEVTGLHSALACSLVLCVTLALRSVLRAGRADAARSRRPAAAAVC